MINSTALVLKHFAFFFLQRALIALILHGPISDRRQMHRDKDQCPFNVLT